MVTLVALAGCGSSPPAIILDPIPTSSSTTRVLGSSSGVASSGSAGVTLKPVTGSWVNVTANLANLQSECGNLSLLSARPDRDMVTVSVAGRGLWASVDGSTEWKPIGQGAGSASIINRGSSIVYDPDRPNTFWLSGIYNGGGVYRTDDNGVTFRQLGTVTHNDAVSVDLSDPQRLTLLAGGHEQLNFYVSRDGGKTWTDLSGSLPKDAGFSSQPLTLDSQTYLLGTSDGSGAGIFRTVDGGRTWTSVYKGPVKGQPLVAKSDGTIYWLTAGGGLVKSVDKGAKWTSSAAAGVLAPTSTHIVELPDGRLAAAGRSVMTSADKGATWRTVGPALPIQPIGLAYSPFRKAFYTWYATCDAPVPANAIWRLDFDHATQ
jgi:hypothetical protein